MFIKLIFKDPIKVKRIRNYVSKMLSVSVFLDITKFVDFRWENADFNRTHGVRHVIHILFGSSLGKV